MISNRNGSDINELQFETDIKEFSEVQITVKI
jgi:hypothetical protein